MSDPLQIVLDANGVGVDDDVAGDLLDSTNSAIKRLGDVDPVLPATLEVPVELSESELGNEEEVVVDVEGTEQGEQADADFTQPEFSREVTLTADEQEDTLSEQVNLEEGESLTLEITAKVSEDPDDQTYGVTGGDGQEVELTPGDNVEAEPIVAEFEAFEFDEATADEENSQIEIVDWEFGEDPFPASDGELEASYQLAENGGPMDGIQSVVLNIEDQGEGDLVFDTDATPQNNFESFEIAGVSLEEDAGGFDPLITSVTDVNPGDEFTGPIVIEINQDDWGDLDTLEPGDEITFTTDEQFLYTEDNTPGEADIEMYLSQEETDEPAVFENTDYFEEDVEYEE